MATPSGLKERLILCWNTECFIFLISYATYASANNFPQPPVQLIIKASYLCRLINKHKHIHYRTVSPYDSPMA